MAELFYPAPLVFDKLNSLVQGFLIEEDQPGVPVLIIKFDAAVLTSIVKGCKLELIICHSERCKAGIVLVIHDCKEPLFILNFENGMAENGGSVPDLILSMLSSGKIRVALFNEAMMPLFSVVMAVDRSENDIKSWLDGEYREPALTAGPLPRVTYYPEASDRGFLIGLANEGYDHTR